MNNNNNDLIGSAKALLVIALSSRPYVEAAWQAGFRVVAIDAFADRQTYAVAEQVILVDYHSNGFDADRMKAVIEHLNADDYCGVLYGSGFEAQPALLQYIADRFPLIGNAPETVAAVKTPGLFFATLQRLGIVHPPFSPSPNSDQQVQYLRKLIGGSGGAHIQYADTQTASPAYYDQCYIAGDSVSVLFLANEGIVEIIGFNGQWLNPSADTPFRYGGAVNNIPLLESVKSQLLQAAQKLTTAFSLTGLISLDAIIHNDVAYILEINPRLSATFDLYPNKAGNILRHIQASQANEMAETDTLYSSADDSNCASAIVYAHEDLEIPADFNWPEWATDFPVGAISIKAAQPVCSVLAAGDSSEAVKHLTQTRVKILLEQLHEHLKIKPTLS